MACLGHPLRPFQVGLVSATRCLGLFDGIEPEDDSGHLVPRCILRVGVEQAEIRDHVGPVVGCEIGIRGGLWRDLRVKFRSIGFVVSRMGNGLPLLKCFDVFYTPLVAILRCFCRQSSWHEFRDAASYPLLCHRAGTVL